MASKRSTMSDSFALGFGSRRLGCAPGPPGSTAVDALTTGPGAADCTTGFGGGGRCATGGGAGLRASVAAGGGGGARCDAERFTVGGGGCLVGAARLLRDRSRDGGGLRSGEEGAEGGPPAARSRSVRSSRARSRGDCAGD